MDSSNEPLALSTSQDNDSTLFPQSTSKESTLSDSQTDFSSQLQELTKIVSPKVSELLSEQALVLDSYMDGFSDDDSYDTPQTSAKGKNTKFSFDDEDGMDDEWRRLEGAQNDLRNELALAAGLSAFMMGDAASSDGSLEEGACDADSISGSLGAQSVEKTIQSKPYTLSDHAKTLGVVRSSTDRGLFTRPLLSCEDLHTLGLVTLPEWISTSKESEQYSSLLSSPQTSSKHNNNLSSEAQTYLEQIQSYTTEYIEPPKTKTLRKLYSGWNPGPGERRPDEGNARHATGEDANRITSYSNNNENDDSSVEEDEFVDVDGVAYPTSSKRREPTPVRTVTIRIRPDVLCGSVMGSITDTVERLGGDMVKRQGGHLRAILPGRKMRVWLPGEWEKAERDGAVQEEQQEQSAPIQRADSNGSSDAAEDSSVATGIASMLFSSPKPKSKGPKYVDLPPYLIDAQLVTKKLGKTCQRLLLVRVYRIQDCVGVEVEEEEEILDVPVPLDGVNNDTTTDLELESQMNIRKLRESAALVQRMKAVGGQGFAIHPPSSDDGDSSTVASHGSTKSYLKSFGDAITSPIRYLSSPTPSHLTYSGKTGRQRGRISTTELMSSELLKKCRSSPSVGMASISAFNAAKLKSHGVFPSLSREDSPFVKASWIFLRECIQEFDRRCLSYR